MKTKTYPNHAPNRDAWTAASGTDKEKSKRRYVELVESLFGKEGSGQLEEEQGGKAGAGPGSAAAAAARTAKASGGGSGGTRFGPVFSVPGGGRDGDGWPDGDYGIDFDDDDEDEDGMLMVRERDTVFFFEFFFSSTSLSELEDLTVMKKNETKLEPKNSAPCPSRRQRTTSKPSPSCFPKARTRGGPGT